MSFLPLKHTISSFLCQWDYLINVYVSYILTVESSYVLGIYYQRDKSRRRRRNRQYDVRTPPEAGTEMSQRGPDASRGAHVIKLHEPPPYYNAVSRCPIIQGTPPPTKKSAPVPPVRNSSAVKKRVQIQEISV